MAEPGKTQAGSANTRLHGLAGIFLLVLLLLFSAASHAGGEEGRLVRVGIFQNEPIVFQDERGVAQGLYVDLLDAIAEQEDWEIHYVLDTWNGCLERLRTNDIDLMTCIAYTEERDAFADFSREIVWTLWGVVFTHPESGLEGIPSLGGKKVAILENGINGLNFLKLCKEFNISCDVLAFPSYDAALKAVESGAADAAVINSVFGAMHGAEYRVNQSSIVFSPINAFFAIPEGKNRDLADIVDAYLQVWKMEKDSVYQQSLNRWLVPGHESAPFTPTWIFTALSVLVLGVLCLFLWTLLLRRLVDARTAALRESEGRFRLIYENAPVLINAFDANGRCVLWNKECRKTFGWTIDEVRAHGNALALFYPDPVVCDEVIQTITSDPDGHFREWHPVTKDGKTLTTMWANFRLPNEVVFSLGHDITERKWAEQELEKHRKHLEELVQARTAQLDSRVTESEGLNSAMVNVMEDLQGSNEELEARGRALIASNQELDAFSYSVSHDLRAPLRHIAGFVELLKESSADSLDATGQRQLKIIAESADRMGRLIDDLLAFSRAGRVELHKTGLDLEELVRGAVREVMEQTQDREIDWQIAPLPEVCADQATLRQVLVNLISNAVKYTRGCEAAHIEVGMVPAEENELVVFVRDNGVGFEMQYVGKLFGVFQRLHSTEEFEGTGVGLANVRRIINRHGGRTWAEGKVGEGAAFYFSLPREVDEG